MILSPWESEPYISFSNRIDEPLDRKALEDFRSSPPAFLLVSAKRKAKR